MLLVSYKKLLAKDNHDNAYMLTYNTAIVLAGYIVHAHGVSCISLDLI